MGSTVVSFCDKKQPAPLAQRTHGCCGDNRAAPHHKDAPGSQGQLSRGGHAIHPYLHLRNQASSGGSKKRSQELTARFWGGRNSQIGAGGGGGTWGSCISGGPIELTRQPAVRNEPQTSASAEKLNSPASLPLVTRPKYLINPELFNTYQSCQNSTILSLKMQDL